MEKSIEQTFAELEELLEKLESPDTTLEESFACYERSYYSVLTDST